MQRRRLHWSPSCYLVHLGLTRQLEGQAHHTVHLGRDWKATFEALTRHGGIQLDPSLPGHLPSAEDPEAAPPGHATLFVLEPTANTRAGLTGPRSGRGCRAAVRPPGRPRLRRPAPRQRGRAGRRPARLGGPGPVGGDAVLPRPPVQPDRLAAAAERLGGRARPGVRRHGHRARGRGADGADLGPPGRRAGAGPMRLAVATQPRTLGAAYERCRQLHARHGRTYYLATLLLPRWKRRHVHALYGFTRYADEIVDDLDSTLDRAGQAAALRAWGSASSPACAASRARTRSCRPCSTRSGPSTWTWPTSSGSSPSMAMDLHTDGYRTYDDLCGYMEGSGGRDRDHDGPDPGVRRPAGRRASTPASSAWPSSSPTSSATWPRTQTRGRVYLPEADLERFGVGRADLASSPGRPGRRRSCWPSRPSGPGPTTGPPSRGSSCSPPPRGRVSGSPSTCTAASLTRSSGPATRSWPAGWRSPTPPPRRRRPPPDRRPRRRRAERRVSVATPGR